MEPKDVAAEIAVLEGAIQRLKQGVNLEPTDVVTPTPGPHPVLQPWAAEVDWASYQNPERTVFTKTFWMNGRVGACVGASVKEYAEVSVLLGMLSTGYRPRHTWVLLADDPNLSSNQSLSSPGDLGWNPKGATYFYDTNLKPDQNFQNWVDAGCPKKNGFGKYRDWETDRKSTRLNSSHSAKSRMPSSA